MQVFFFFFRLSVLFIYMSLIRYMIFNYFLPFWELSFHWFCVCVCVCVIYSFIFDCTGSPLLCTGFLRLQRAGATLLQCSGCLLHWLLSLRSAGSGHMGPQGLSCPTACGIFPDQGLNPCPLHWQADS